MWMYRGDAVVDPENLEGLSENLRASAQIGADLDDPLRSKFGDDQELGDRVDLLEPTWDLLSHVPRLGEAWVLCRQKLKAPLRLAFVQGAADRRGDPFEPLVHSDDVRSGTSVARCGPRHV